MAPRSISRSQRFSGNQRGPSRRQRRMRLNLQDLGVAPLPSISELVYNGNELNIDYPTTTYEQPPANLYVLSEFPSLSGGPQPQQPAPNTSQSMWGANASIRNTQQTPVQNQRQLPQMPGQGPLQSQSQSQMNAQSIPGHSPSEDSFAPGGEGYRFGNQGSVNPLQGLSQTQTGSSSQPRSSLTSPGGESERPSRTTISGAPGLPIPQELRGRTSAEIGSQPPGLPTPQQMQQPFGQDGLGSPQSTIPGQTGASMKRLADMTESERWGMPGLFALLNRDHPDFNEFQNGVDLTQLGMDLNRSE